MTNYENSGFFDTLSDLIGGVGEGGKLVLTNLKEASGMPWWATIPVSTLALRFALFPLRLRAWRNGRLIKLTTEHCNNFEGPKFRLIAKSAPEFKTKMIEKHTELLKYLKVSPWKSLSQLPFSVPLFLGFAAGLRAIDFNGAGLFDAIWKDFGEAQISSALPVLLTNFFYIQSSSKSAKEPKQADTLFRRLRPKIPFYLGHSINLCSFIILSQVPSSVNLFLFISSLSAFLETKLVLKPSGLIENFIRKDFDRQIGYYIKNGLLIKK